MSIKAKIAVHHAQRVKKDPQGHERIPAPLRLARRVHVQRTNLPNMDVVVVGDRVAPRERFELPRERAHAISSRAHYQAMRSRLYPRRAPFLV